MSTVGSWTIVSTVGSWTTLKLTARSAHGQNIRHGHPLSSTTTAVSVSTRDSYPTHGHHFKHQVRSFTQRRVPQRLGANTRVAPPNAPRPPRTARRVTTHHPGWAPYPADGGKLQKKKTQSQPSHHAHPRPTRVRTRAHLRRRSGWAGTTRPRTSTRPSTAPRHPHTSRRA